MKFLQNLPQVNRDNYHNERCETSHTLRNIERLMYLKGKLSKIETSSKNMNIRDLYECVNEFKKRYRPPLWAMWQHACLSRSEPGFDPQSGQVSWVRFFRGFPRL